MVKLSRENQVGQRNKDWEGGEKRKGGGKWERQKVWVTYSAGGASNSGMGVLRTWEDDATY